MMDLKATTNRRNVITPSSAGNPVRFRDATATVKAMLHGGATATTTHKKAGGCKGCGR